MRGVCSGSPNLYFNVVGWILLRWWKLYFSIQIEDPSSQAQIRAAEKLTSQENSGRPKEPEQETTAQIDEEEEEDDEEVCNIEFMSKHQK